MAGSTTLNGALDNSNSAILVTSSATFPASGFKVQIDSEIIHVYRVAGQAWFGCNRGWDGTTPASHLNGAAVNEIATTAEMAIRDSDNVLRTYDRRWGFPHSRYPRY